MFKKVVLEKSMGRWKQRRMEWVPEALAVQGLKLKAELQSNCAFTVYENDWEVMEVLETDLAPPPVMECRRWELMGPPAKKKR